MERESCNLQGWSNYVILFKFLIAWRGRNPKDLAVTNILCLFCFRILNITRVPKKNVEEFEFLFKWQFKVEVVITTWLLERILE